MLKGKLVRNARNRANPASHLSHSTYDAKLSCADEVEDENLSKFHDNTRPCDALNVLCEVLSEVELLVDEEEFAKLLEEDSTGR